MYITNNITVVSTFPEIDFFIHGKNCGNEDNIVSSELDVLAVLTTADIMIASSGGLSRFAAILNTHGIILCPESSGYPLHAHTLYGKKQQVSLKENDEIKDYKLSENGKNSDNQFVTENNVFFKMMPKFPRMLLVDATHLFNMGSGFFNHRSKERDEEQLMDGGKGNGGISVGKLKGMQSAIYGAKRSKLAYEGGLWIEETVFNHAIELRIDPLSQPQQQQQQKGQLGESSVTISRDQCLRIASQNTPKGKVCDDRFWWKCSQQL